MTATETTTAVFTAAGNFESMKRGDRLILIANGKYHGIAATITDGSEIVAVDVLVQTELGQNPRRLLNLDMSIEANAVILADMVNNCVNG